MAFREFSSPKRRRQSRLVGRKQVIITGMLLNRWEQVCVKQSPRTEKGGNNPDGTHKSIMGTENGMDHFGPANDFERLIL
ncbi:hypothetical protein NPIL_243181 [Nephila pilipes]|uniref:Uncharacterized protein n=1 Tax=Nephila pilipes TaxID=299642 RepID=A0A8X6R1U3_NEPPI|nr:hypothetical protein NPIL_243181 [Nephila pilipes]